MRIRNAWQALLVNQETETDKHPGTGRKASKIAVFNVDLITLT